MVCKLALNSIRGKSGKDTLIGLIESHGYKVHRVAFADILKRDCAQVLAGNLPNLAEELERRMHTSEKDEKIGLLSFDQLPSSLYKEWLMEQFPETGQYRMAMSLRWHLQQYGTEYVRNHLGKPNHWLDQGLKAIEEAPQGTDFVVVTDMRLPNEYEALNDGIRDFRTIRIVRDWFIPGVDDQPYHVSDIALMAHPFDHLIVNRLGEPWGMIDQLKEQGVHL